MSPQKPKADLPRANHRPVDFTSTAWFGLKSDNRIIALRGKESGRERLSGS
jgi:hypothetical protein